MNVPYRQSERAREALSPLFETRGLTRAEPAILQPAETFLDLTGEDIRRRLYFVTDPAGRELCLRPDYTIPVSRAHLAEGRETPAGYCYLGPVFRYRGEGEPGEFLQAGIERFGDRDAEAADAGVLGFAMEAAHALGLREPGIRLGDPGLVMAFVAALDLPEPWPRRLRSAFGRPGGLRESLAPRTAPDTDRAAVLGALDPGDQAAARAAVEEMAAIAGIAPMGGRSPQEIAERLLEQARLAADGGLDDHARNVLLRLAEISGTPEAAAGELRAIAGEAGIDIAADLDSFSRRNDLMAAQGVPVDRISFSADFGRRLDYYTGFVFELFDPKNPQSPVVGGGRYDRLLSLLGAARPVPAVGCAVWIDRVMAESRP